MDIVLVPGLWLHGSSWDAVTPYLQEAGHRTWALTLPGMEGPDVDRSGVTLADQVSAVVAAIDEAGGDERAPVLVVGHSLGAAIAHAAVDARPDRVARAVHVGGFPAGDGETLLEGLPVERGEVAMPDWAAVEPEMVVDFEPDALARFQAAAIPSPAAVLAGPQRLHDPRRYEVPVTAVCPEYTAAQLQAWIAADEEPVRELGLVRDVRYVDLPGGHWPQLTQPEALARVLLEAAD